MKKPLSAIFRSLVLNLNFLACFAFITLFTITVHAQTIYLQNTCPTAINLGTHDTCNSNVQTLGSQLWLAFTPAESDSLMTFTVNNLNKPNVGHIHSIALYSACGGTAIDSVGLSNDTSTAPLVLTAAYLLAGHTYFILLAREVIGCSSCTGTAQFGYCLHIKDQPCSSVIIATWLSPQNNYMSKACQFCTDTVCEGTKIAFIETGENGGSDENTEWTQWIFNGGIPAQPNGWYHDTDSVYVTYPNPGLYTITGTHKEPGIDSADSGVGCERTIQIYVIPPAKPSFTINPNPVCSGQLVCFHSTSQPNNPANLTWVIDGVSYPSDTIPGLPAHAFPDTVFCTIFCTPGAHTIMLKDSDACGIDSITQKLIVNPLTAYFTANNSCVGQPVLFNDLSSCIVADTANVTYSWRFGNGDTSTQRIPPPQVFSNPGTFFNTLTITETPSYNFGTPLQYQDTCTESSTFTSSIVISAFPSPPAISGPITACSDSAIYSVVSPHPGYSYTWTASGGIPSSGSGSSANINFYPHGGTIYWTASNNGCTAVDSFSVLPCCIDSNRWVINIYNQTASAVFPALDSIEHDTININGTFTIDKNISFFHCNLRMGPLAKIIINPNDTLKLSGDPTGCTHVYAGCGYMWRGIFIQPKGTLISNRNTVIEDADSAIVATDGNGSVQSNYKLVNTFLNNNYADIVIEPYFGTFSGTATNCVFSCRNYATFPWCNGVFAYQSANLPGDSLLPPHTGIRCYTGININNVGSFTENGANIYDNLDNGIRSTFSNITVQKDTFEHINTANNIYSAIWAEGGGILLMPQNTLTVGGTAATANLFTDCTNGVFAKYAFKNINIGYNTYNFVVPATNNPLDTRAIWLESTGIIGTDVATIMHNTINSAYTGIECDMNSHINSTIRYNNINGFVFCSGYPFNEVGITLNEAGSHFAHYDVGSNTIGGLHYGISAYSVYGAILDYNNITLIASPIQVNCNTPIYGNGISLYDGLDCEVSSNDISTTFVTGNQFFTGIYQSMSPSTTLCSNTIKGMWNGMNFAGNSFPSTVFGNSLVNTGLNHRVGATGMLLTFGGIIGQQGGPGTPSDNKWFGTLCHTNRILSPISLFYVRNGLIFSVLPGCPTYFSYSITSPIGIQLCFVPPVASLLPLSQQIATNQVNYSIFPDTSGNISKHELTKFIWSNDSLLSDTVLHHFNDSIKLASMGQLLAADTLMSDSTGLQLPGTLATVNSVIPANNIETNLQTVSQIYLQSLISQNDTLNSSQLNTIRALSNKCPFEDGTAVYMARAIRVAYDGFMVYGDSCESNTNQDKEHRPEHVNNSTTQESYLNIYPNPNNGNFTMDYKLNNNQTGKVILFNSVGQQIGAYLLNNSVGKMTVSNPELTNGVYIYELSTSDNHTTVGKVIIIK